MFKINNKKFYSKSIKEFGVSAQGVHWSTQFSQYKRFEVLCSFLEKEELKNASIVDAGCGFGEFYNFLQKRELLPKEYCGIDCEAQMIQISQHRFPKTTFYVKDVLKDNLPVADYYMCSGAMNLLPKRLFFKFIQQCYKQCQKGFIFNFLKKESFNHIDPRNVIAFCKELNGEYILEEHYLRNDLSIFLKKS